MALRHGLLAEDRIRTYLCLLYFQTWDLHARTAALLETARSLQLLSKWLRENCIVFNVWQWKYKTPDNAHEAWIIARKDGPIVGAHCTCMAG